MKKVIAKIAENREIARRFYRIRVESAYLAKNAKAGQFFEVKCSGTDYPLLRRPLGLHNVSKNSIEMLYEVIGNGTNALSRRKPGEELDVIGPLGNGFTETDGKKIAIMVAGGVGVAPLFALAQKLVKKGRAVHVIIGAKNKEGLLCEKEFKRSGCSVTIATEDGSKGRKGYATDALAGALKDVECKKAMIYACGPHPMLKAVAHIASIMGLPCQVSMEEKMACGVGVCMGCPVKMKRGGYKMVCKDGPVFDAKEISW